MVEIDQQTMADLLQFSGQYLIPLAALLRALYLGARGKFPEGLLQIVGASFLSAITEFANSEAPNIQHILQNVVSNTVFTAGLLAFIMTYLLRMRYRGWFFDVLVGSIVGIIAWFGSSYLLNNDFEIWTLPATAIGGGIAFLILRALLRQIRCLIGIATVIFWIAFVALIVTGGIYVVQYLMSGLNLQRIS